MKELILLRHGKAERPIKGQVDHERHLAPRGYHNIQEQAMRLKPEGVTCMVVSDAIRTIETAEVLRSAWINSGVTKLPDLDLRRDAYLANAETWMDLIRLTAPTFSCLWAVGHNPGISDLVTLLTGDYIGMATADIVRIQLELDAWHDISTNCGRVVEHRPGRGD